ncbi:MAG: hypothetical protein RLZZ93_1486 [Actinomycetota bacterium]
MRYMAPVSRYSKPSREASARAIVDLPAPAGPSMATMTGVEFMSPAGAERAAFVVARRTLHPDNGPFAELVDG